MGVMDPACVDCAHWDSRDGLVGFCPEVTAALRLDLNVLVHGLAPCRTMARGRCALFEPGLEALAEARAEAAHRADLEGEAGRSYPASLR